MRLRDLQDDLGLRDMHEEIFASGPHSAERARRAASEEGSQRSSDAQATEVEKNVAVTANESEGLPVVDRRDHYDEEGGHCECPPFGEVEKDRAHAGCSGALMDPGEGGLGGARLPLAQAGDVWAHVDHQSRQVVVDPHGMEGLHALKRP